MPGLRDWKHVRWNMDVGTRERLFVCVCVCYLADVVCLRLPCMTLWRGCVVVVSLSLSCLAVYWLRMLFNKCVISDCHMWCSPYVVFGVLYDMRIRCSVCALLFFCCAALAFVMFVLHELRNAVPLLSCIWRAVVQLRGSCHGSPCQQNLLRASRHTTNDSASGRRQRGNWGCMSRPVPAVWRPQSQWRWC